MLYLLKNGEQYNKNERARLLCENDPNFGFEWSALAEVDFSPKESEDGKPAFNKKGLDALSVAELESLQKNPPLFAWPESVPQEARAEIVQRSLDFAKSGKSMWELANVGVRAIDDFTLECTLKSPTAFFSRSRQAHHVSASAQGDDREVWHDGRSVHLVAAARKPRGEWRLQTEVMED